MQKKDFTVRQLIDNPSFQRMVKGIAPSEEVDKWNRWIEASPENREKAKEAISAIAGFEFKPAKLPDVEDQWNKLYQKTAGKQKLHKYQKRKRERAFSWIVRAAAVILIVGLAGVGGFYFSNNDESVTHLSQMTHEKTITTSAEEEKTLSFSNGSKIILNSNSTLTYKLGLLHSQTIEVTLEGEAWFEAENNLSSTQPAFTVITPDGIIRDIGTKFLVTIQKEKSRVVLQEGIVEVEHVDKYPEGNRLKNKVFRVEKGEMVEFNQENILTRERINPTFYTSWATGFMELNQTGLEEFAQYVRQQFGVQVQLNDSGLTEVTLDGTVYFRSLDELVRSISEVTGIPAYRSADKQTVFIGEIE